MTKQSGIDKNLLSPTMSKRKTQLSNMNLTNAQRSPESQDEMQTSFFQRAREKHKNESMISKLSGLSRINTQSRDSKSHRKFLTRIASPYSVMKNYIEKQKIMTPYNHLNLTCTNTENEQFNDILKSDPDILNTFSNINFDNTKQQPPNQRGFITE